MHGHRLTEKKFWKSQLFNSAEIDFLYLAAHQHIFSAWKWRGR